MGTLPDQCSSSFPKKRWAVCVKNVCKSYGNFPALDNISMNVGKGIVYGLLGASGSGKTTILACIVGLKKWDSGTISVMGSEIKNETCKIARNLGYMPQDVALYEQLTITEMLKYYSKLYHMSNEKFQQQMSLLEELLNLPGYGSSCISNLSGGQKRRVSLALTLLHSPSLLILDEPTVGLDPLLRESIWQYLYNLTYTHKTTIIITTHYIEEVKNANMVGVMRKGTLLVEDDPAALMQAHQTSILEEVVLKICHQDRTNRRKSLEAQLKKKLSHNPDGSSSDNLQSVKVSKKDKPLCKWLCKEKKQTNSCDNKKRRNSYFEDIELCEDKKTLTQSLICSVERTLGFAQVVWMNFIRHPIFIFLVVFLPPFQLFSTGIVIGVEPKYTPVGIVNHEALNWQTTCLEREKLTLAQHSSGNESYCDLSTLSCDLIKQFNKGTYMEPVEFTSEEAARYAVTRGNVAGFIQIPENYSTRIVERAVTRLFSDIETVNGTIVTLHMDMSAFVTMFVVITELFRSFGNFIKDVTTQCNFDLRLIEIPFFYRQPVYGQLDTSARDYVLPALVAGILFEVAFTVTPLVYIHDVKQGTLERSRVAGLRFTEMITGLTITMTLLSVIQAVICYLSLQFGLGFHILGSIPAFICVCLATAFCAGALGLVVGILFKDEFMLVLAAVFLIPILMIYAGILRPIEIIPHPFRSLIFYFFPTASIVKPFRFIVNRGVSLAHPMVWPGILVTLFWGMVFSIVCLILLNKIKR